MGFDCNERWTASLWHFLCSRILHSLQLLLYWYFMDSISFIPSQLCKVLPEVLWWYYFKVTQHFSGSFQLSNRDYVSVQYNIYPDHSQTEVRNIVKSSNSVLNKLQQMASITTNAVWKGFGGAFANHNNCLMGENRKWQHRVRYF